MTNHTGTYLWCLSFVLDDFHTSTATASLLAPTNHVGGCIGGLANQAGEYSTLIHATGLAWESVMINVPKNQMETEQQIHILGGNPH